MLASTTAASARGPKAGIPAASMASTMPRARGSSGATTTKSMALALAQATIAVHIGGLHGLRKWQPGRCPPLPGAQKSWVTLGDWASFQQMACSRPPPPTTKTFISKPRFKVFRRQAENKIIPYSPRRAEGGTRGELVPAREAGARSACISRRKGPAYEWWNRRMPVKAMTMPYLSQVSMTLSSRMEPPGWAIYCTPLLRCAARCCRQRGRRRRSPRTRRSCVAIQAFFSSLVSASGLDGEGVLPHAVGQHVLILVGDVDVDGVVPVGPADAVHERQGQHLGMLAQAASCPPCSPARRVQWMRLCWPAPTPMAWPSLT